MCVVLVEFAHAGEAAEGAGELVSKQACVLVHHCLHSRGICDGG